MRPDSVIVRRLRRRVRATVKASPALRAESKRARRRRQTPPWLLRGLGSLVVVGMLIGRLHLTPDVTVASDFFMLWAIAVCLYQAAALAARCHVPANLWIPYNLPLPDDAVFAGIRRDILRQSAWLALDSVIFSGAATLLHGTGRVVWIVVPLTAATHWVICNATALALVCWRPHVPYMFGASMVWIGGLFTFHSVKDAPLFAAYIAPAFNAIRTVTPAGWVQAAMVHALEQSAWVGVAALAALSVAGGFAMRWLIDVLRRRFAPEKVFDYTPAISSAGVADLSRERETENEAFSAAQETAGECDPKLVRLALKGAMEEPAGLVLFSRGPLERWIVRRLSERARIVVDWMQPAGILWTRGWWIAFALLILARLAGQFFGGDVVLSGVAGAALAACFALPVFGGKWIGFDAVQLDHAVVGVHAFSPLGFWQIARTVLVVNLLRTLAALPLAVLAALFCFTRTPLPPLVAIDYAVRVLAIVAALQPVCVLFLFSQHTNDSSARWWSTVIVVVGLAIAAVLVVSLAIAALAVESTLGAFACIAGLTLLTGATLGLYGWTWNRGWFDLLKVPRR